MPEFTRQAEALAAADAALQLAFAGASVGFWYFDCASRRTWHSSSVRAMLGDPPEAAVVDIDTQLHPDDFAVARAAGQDLANARTRELEVEFRMRHRDGGYRWMLNRGRVAQRDASGRATHLIGTVMDITTRKQEELAAESSRQLLNALINAIPHSIFWKDDRGIYLGCNAAFATKTRFATPEQLVGHSDEDLGWPADRLASVRAIDALVLQGDRRMVNQHIEVPAPDGIGHRLSTVLPFHHAASGFTGLIGVITDVTELQRARASAALAEKRWRVAIESSGAAVWEIDMEQGTVWHSPRMAAMLGYGPNALQSTLAQLYDLVHPDDIPGSLQLRERVESGATDQIESEYRLRCADGSYRWMLSRGAVIDRDFSGRPLRLVGTHTDITDEYEGRDRAAHARQLESLGNLAAGVAHEINTPLQFVGDSVGFLRTGLEDLARLSAGSGNAGLERLSTDMPRALELVQEGIMRIGEIVRGMRVFAHPDARDKEPARLDDLLRSALAVARHEYKHVAEVRTEFTELPPVPCHPGELGQVFVNVIVNAAHAIAIARSDGATRGLITLRTQREDAHAVVEIADTGCGIEADKLERIFEPFYTTKPHGQGTGQGLAIARTVIERHHGGRISASSRPGAGAVIRIELPLATGRNLVAA